MEGRRSCLGAIGSRGVAPGYLMLRLRRVELTRAARAAILRCGRDARGPSEDGGGMPAGQCGKECPRVSRWRIDRRTAARRSKPLGREMQELRLGVDSRH